MRPPMSAIVNAGGFVSVTPFLAAAVGAFGAALPSTDSATPTTTASTPSKAVEQWTEVSASCAAVNPGSKAL